MGRNRRGEGVVVVPLPPPEAPMRGQRSPVFLATGGGVGHTLPPPPPKHIGASPPALVSICGGGPTIPGPLRPATLPSLLAGAGAS